MTTLSPTAAATGQLPSAYPPSVVPGAGVQRPGMPQMVPPMPLQQPVQQVPPQLAPQPAPQPGVGQIQPPFSRDLSPLK